MKVWKTEFQLISSTSPANLFSNTVSNNAPNKLFSTIVVNNCYLNDFKCIFQAKEELTPMHSCCLFIKKIPMLSGSFAVITKMVVIECFSKSDRYNYVKKIISFMSNFYAVSLYIPLLLSKKSNVVIGCAHKSKHVTI